MLPFTRWGGKLTGRNEIVAKTRHNYGNLTKSRTGQALYARWCKIRKDSSPEFQAFEDFAAWAHATAGDELKNSVRLHRIDATKPYSPENCCWGDTEKALDPSYKQEQIRKWNRTVNRIRKYYGMPLFNKEGEDLP